MAKFMILSLPRSRSFWLSHFLSYQDREIGHDLLVESTSIAHFVSQLKYVDGACETAAMVGWKLLVERMGGLRYVVIKRPLVEVVESLRRKGIACAPGFLEQREAMLDAFSQVRGVRTYSYSDLEHEWACKEIFEFCLQLDWDYTWWKQLDEINVQIDFLARLDRINSNAKALDALNSEVLFETSKLGGSSCLHLN